MGLARKEARSGLRHPCHAPRQPAAIPAIEGNGKCSGASKASIPACLGAAKRKILRTCRYNRRVIHLPPLDGRWLWLVVAAFLAGVLNAVAGGGSFLLFPAMLGTGMQPIQANATNTVALWPGQLTSIAAYLEDIRKNLRLAIPMGVAGLLGGAVGAIVLLHTPQTTFLHLVPWLLLVAATIFALSGPVSRWLGRWQAHKGSAQAQKPSSGGALLFVLTAIVCFYIGYFGAGAGFLIITLLSLFGFTDLNEINALKVVSTTLANGVAFLLFVVSGQVEWRYCLAAMFTCAIGGYSSARLARRVPQPVLRGTVIVIGFGMAAWFFWKNR
jgi:uncharacterized protein